MLSKNVRKMVGIAFMMAMVIVLQFLSGVIPAVGGFSISLVLIPIVLGGALFGPGAGALLGATFGVIVTINCITGADPGGAMVFQANPILCVLVVMAKGTLAGWLAALAFKLLQSRNSYLAMLVAACVCPIVNSGTFIACMLLFFKDVLAVWAGGGEIIAYILTGLIVANFLPELIINVVFSPAGNTIMKIVKRK